MQSPRRTPEMLAQEKKYEDTKDISCLCVLRIYKDHLDELEHMITMDRYTWTYEAGSEGMEDTMDKVSFAC